MARIIVIDDEKDVRDVLKEVLERAGFDVEVAANGDDGLELLRSKGADVVITDIIMPGKNGVETVQDIRKNFPNTRVIVISGGGNVTPLEYEPSAIKTSAYLASATAAGADVTLTKPFDRREILDAVSQLIAG
jgi:CheY-like chemotaxis protein